MLSLKQARTVFVGQRVSKYFEPNPDEQFPGGVFSGTVTAVRANAPDSEGVVWDLLFGVK